MKVYVNRTSDASLRAEIAKALEWIDCQSLIRSDTRIFIKPNLTWRLPMAGVTTTPAFIDAAVSALRERTAHITVGEADGGYHSFSAEEAFESHGVNDLKKRYGVDVVNLSRGPVTIRDIDVAGKTVRLELPELLVEGIDLLVTLPVPKVHAMTGVSLSFKNQWGCQPGTMRLRNHPEFTRKILAINKLCHSRIALYDGKYFLDKTGPMIGEAREMNMIIASNDLGAGDLVCCDIMGIPAGHVSHLRLAQNEGMMPRRLDELELNRSLNEFRTHKFTLHRSLINYIALLAFHSQTGTRLFYDSAAAGPIHRVLYAIRANPLVGRMLYGRIGPPEIEGKR